MGGYHLAEVNIGTLKAPIDDPMIAEFKANLGTIAGASQTTMVASYDASQKTATVTGSMKLASVFGRVLGGAPESITRAARATTSTGPRYEVCVMITDPSAAHTLLAVDNSRVNFTNCMVQVNNVFPNPGPAGKERWVAYPRPQLVLQYHDGRTGELLYAEAIRAGK